MTSTALLPLHEMSRAERLALQPLDVRESYIASLTDEEADLLRYDYDFLARAKQMFPPGMWTYCLWMAGRGFGKTFILTSFASYKAMTMPGSRGVLVGATAGDVRDILVEGESGVLNVGYPKLRPKYEPSKLRLTWKNGSTAALRSADEPDRFRGLQGHWAALDELASWRYLDMVWEMLMYGMRLGDNPQIAIGTTPRPLPLIKQLMKMAQDRPDETKVITGSSYENRSNLSPKYIQRIITPREGTRLGRQEIHAEILDDTPGALWKRELIDTIRVIKTPPLARVVVAIDPSGSSGENAAEAGIIVAGVDKVGNTGKEQGFVLDDVSLLDTPEKWATAAVTAYHKYKADCIVAEVNYGGEMVEAVIRSIDPSVSFKMVRASRSKQVRAEPVSALYSKGRVWHVGAFPKLEDEYCTWVPGAKSPNRLDAAVWALTELMLPEEVPEEEIAWRSMPVKR